MSKKHIIIAAIIFFSAFLFYCITSGTTVAFGDSGEFITASSNMGILHPPGYPLYSILGKFFTFIPAGNTAFRVNMMSAFFGALTLFFIYLIMINITDSIPAAVISAACLLFSNTFWYYSHYAKGYTLNLFFLSLLIFCALKHKENNKWIYLWGFLFGLACTYHYQSTVILLPAFAYIFLIEKKMKIKDFLIAVLVGSLALLLYLFLPLRAMTSPELYHWGDPTTFSGFKEIVTGKIYGWHEAATRTGLENTVKQILMYWGFMVTEFNPAGIIAGILGLIFLFRINFRFFIFTLIIYLTNVIAVSYLITTQIDIFLEAILPGLFLPAHVIFSLWIGFTLYKAEEKFKKPSYILFIIPVISLFINFHSCYQRNNFIAYDFAKNTLITTEKDAYLITSGDNDTFPLWYLQQVEKVRPDIKLITMGLIGEKNYEDYLRDVEKVPWDEDLSSLLTPEDAIMIFLKRNKDKKIYITFHAAGRMPKDLTIAPRGILYEIAPLDKEKDFTLCKTLLEEKYSFRGLNDKGVYKDFLTSSMLGPYAKAFFDLGTLYTNQKNPKKAKECFNKIKEIDYGKRPDIKKEFNTYIEYLLAKNAIEEKEWEMAVNLLKNKEEIFKDNADFYLIRGIALREQGEYEKSFNDLNKALELNPGSGEINLELGKVYYEVNDIQNGIYKITIALQLQKDLPEGNYWLAKCYEKYELYDKAIEKYEEELKLYPDHQPSIDSLNSLHKKIN